MPGLRDPSGTAGTGPGGLWPAALAGQSVMAILLLAGLLLGIGGVGVVMTHSEDWERQSNEVSDEVIRDLGGALDFSGARGVMRQEDDGTRYLTSARLELHLRSGDGLFIGNLTLVATGPDGAVAEWPAGVLARIMEPVRDVDGSFRYGLVNQGDLVELKMTFGETPLRLAPGHTASLVLGNEGGAARTLHLVVPEEAAEESVVDLTVEVLGDA